MAAFYELRYWKNFTQPDGSIIRLEIHGKGIKGVSMTAYEIGPVVQALALNIQGQTDDVDAPIVKTSLSMTFVDAPDHADAWLKKCGDWEEFYTNDATMWKVILKGKKNASSSSYAQLWGGYITPDSFSEELRYRGSVTIVARDNIGHMQDFPFDAEGDENGMISLRELVRAAWEKIESPMELYLEDARQWMQCDGVQAYNTMMNASAFKGMNWYEAVEKALYAYGAVMRYNGQNEVLVSSLRYMPQQGKGNMDAVTHLEPAFIASAHRELTPAARRIEESVSFETGDGWQLPLAKGIAFVGSEDDVTFLSKNVFGETTRTSIPVNPIDRTSGEGWQNDTSASLFFNPKMYTIRDAALKEDAERMIFLACNTDGSHRATFRKTIYCKDMEVRFRFGRVVQRDDLGGVQYSFGFASGTEDNGIGSIRVKKVQCYVTAEQNGITQYWTGSEWQTAAYRLELAPNEGEFGIGISFMDITGQAALSFIFENIIVDAMYDYSKGHGLYVPISTMSFGVLQGLSLCAKNNVNTNYNEKNNVIISRTPELAPAMDEVPFPAAIKNGIFYKSDGVYLPAKAWNWDGGTPQQMAVYNHLQLLCYHSKPNNLITGDIVNADVIKTAAIYVWGGKEHLLISGTYNYLNGRIEGAVLREFVRYDDMWGDVTGSSLPDVETGSATSAEEGGSSSSGVTNENTTNVVIGGEGGGSVTIDPFLSDTSTNAVQNKAIKAYVDAADKALSDRITEIEENGAGGGGQVDTAMSDTSENAVQNKVIKTYVDNESRKAYDTAYTDAVAASTAYTNSAKQQLIASKAGAFYLVPESNLFLAFTTEEAKNEYVTTGSTDQSNILFQQVIQGGGGSGDSTDTYRMTILGLDDSYNYTTASDTMPISCTFKSEVKRAGEDTYEVVPEAALFTVVVYKSTGTVSTVANGVIVNNGGTFNFDLKPYVGNGENTVTVKATGLISSKDGNAYTKVNVTTMSLAPFGFAWYDAWKQGQDYLIRLKVQGALNKTLHVQINGNEITESLGTFSSDSTPKDFMLKSSYHPASTGVYNLKIWMTADASGVSSEVLNYNIMCVKSSDVNTAKLVCINEVATFADNYAESKLFSYATYNGGGASSTPTLSITKGSTTIVSNTASATTGVAYDFTFAFSLDMSESSASIVAKAVFGNTQSATITLRNETAFAPVGGYSFYMDAATRSNLDAYKKYLQNEANSQRVSASWTDMAWVDGMDGWTTDSDGNKCLLIPAMSKANVNLTPMKNISTITIEMFYKVTNVSDFDEEIITIATNTASSWMGLKIKPTNICLHSRLLFSDDLKQSYNVQDEKPVHLVIAINSNYREHGNVAIIYVNGVKKCTFEWSTNDSFAHDGNLVLGSSTADLYLYKMRIYGFQFDWPQVMQNYISCLTTASEKSKTKRKEDSILDDNNQVDYDKVYGKYNTFVVELPKGAVLPNRKDNPSNNAIDGSNLYINIVQDPSCTIQGDFLNVPLEGQGTTAMTYYRWNLRSKTSSTYDKFRITAKKNVASSMHSHKMGATRLFNDLNRAIVGANDADGRVAVYQYPVYGFQKIEYEDTPGSYYYDFIGLYTIGPDKGDASTFGYDNATYENTLIHMEGTDHSPRGVGMDYPWEKMSIGLSKGGDTCLGTTTSGGGFSAAWEIGACCDREDDDFTGIKDDLDREFAPAYKIDYECTPMIVGLPLGDTIGDANANISAFRAQVADNGFSYSDCIIYDNDYYTYYYDEVSKTYVKDGRMVYSGLTSAHGYSKSTLDAKSSVLAKTQYIRECRKARYRAEMEQYWHLDDSLFHACFLDLIGATDNEKKNSYPYKFKPLASQGKWRWRQDDLDTIFDVNNQGSSDKKYSILNTDKQGTVMVFKGNTSYHWRCIREYYKNELKGMMQRIFAKMIEFCPSGYGASNIQKLVGCIRKYFWDYAQEYFTGGAYNLDARWTYEDTWLLPNVSAYNAVPPLQQSLGSHYEAETAWVTMRMLFLASMYEFGAFSDYQDSSEGQIKFRQGNDFTFTLTPAIDMRPAIASGQSEVIYASGRVLAGNSVSITIASETGADTDVYIQGADWMQEVGDFSTVKVGSQTQPFEVTSKRLQKLKVGDATASKVSTNIARLAIHECPSLVEIDARNITDLANTVDLTKCPRLRRAYFGGTSLTSIKLPEGSKIQKYGLPSTIQSLELRKLPLLTTSGLTYGDLNALTYLWVEDNAYLDGYDMLKAALEDGSPLNNIRVIGFSKTVDADDTAFLLALAEGDYHGITSTGAADNTIPPVLVGTVNYDTIDGEVYDALTKAYGSNLTINYNKLIAFIKFADDEVKRVLLANGVDTNNDGGIDKSEAAAVTSIGGWFRGNTTIVSFDEFEKFTGVTFLGTSTNQTSGGAFNGCSNLVRIKLPASLVHIRPGTFYGCPNLASVGDLSHVGQIDANAFVDTALGGEIDLSGLTATTIGYAAFARTKITKILSMGATTIINGSNSTRDGAFSGCSLLTEVNLPNGLTSMGNGSFYQCVALKYIDLPASVTNIGNYAFAESSGMTHAICRATTPPTAGLRIFDKMSIPIYVYSQSMEAYKTATNWSTYASRLAPLEDHEDGGYVPFADAEVLSVLVAKGVDTNGSGYMSKNECEAVTSLGTWFTGNTAIVSFDELQYFTGLTDIYGVYPDGAFMNCTSLQSICIPEGVTSIEGQAFLNCTALTNVTFPNTLNSISWGAFNKAALTNLNVVLDNVTTIGEAAFRQTGLRSVVLPRIVTITSNYGSVGNSNTFAACANLQYALLGNSCTNVGNWGCFQDSAITTLICLATTPPSGGSICDNTPISRGSGYIYVPDASVDAYKATGSDGWAKYSSRIKGISSLATDNPTLYAEIEEYL